ncbi:MAG: methionyl-tRNA formyltransferase [Verrucomicrobia bacterium]|nr:methionyl-tRNA formyltransferase [Verrucomicrobiota bacterium]
MPLRIIFMGTPELASESLAALLRETSLQVIAVVTQPDRPKGRDLKLTPSPVKQIAVAAGLPVLQPLKARDENFIAGLRSLQPELIVVAAFGQILPATILELPHHGCLNVHTSLLPKYRGASPIQAAILNGDAETGVTIMKMDVGLDTGDMIAQRATPIRDEDNAATLHDRLALLGAQLLVETIPGYVSGAIQPRPQPHELATHVAKIRKEDGRINWQQPARAIWNRIRAFTPWPGAFTTLDVASKPALLKIWEADVVLQRGTPGAILGADKNGIIVGCGSDALRIFVLQREGGRRMSAQEFLAGNPLAAGQRLGANVL